MASIECSFCGKKEGDYFHDVKPLDPDDIARLREMGATDAQIQAFGDKEAGAPRALGDAWSR